MKRNSVFAVILACVLCLITGCTSTSYPFLREVMPKYAVISVGKDNFIRTPYGSRFEPFKGCRCADVQNRPARRYNYDKRRR